MTVAQAIVSPTSVSYCVFIAVNASGKVRYASSVVIMSGQVKLFHAPIKVKIATVSIEDFTSGTITFHRIFALDAPSIWADSISSVGIARMAWRMTKTPKAVGSGRIRALKVFTHPKPLTRR